MGLFAFSVLALALFVQLHHQLGPAYDVPRAGDAVVVTGASSGIGRDAALHLANAGHTVFAGVRKQGEPDALSGVSNVVPVILDVTQQQHHVLDEEFT